MLKLLICIIFLFSFTSCKKDGGEEVTRNVSVNTTGIFYPVEVYYYTSAASKVLVSGDYDFGEYELNSGDTVLKFTIKNNTDFPLTDLVVEFGAEEEERAFHYALDENGDRQHPGILQADDSNACSSVLASHSSCNIYLAINANAELGEKKYTDSVVFSYKNLVKNGTTPKVFKVYAGNEASLVFQNEETSFPFGNQIRSEYLVERSVKQTYHQKLTVTNRGDLTARSVSVGFPNANKCTSLSANNGDGANCNTLGADFIKTHFTDAWEYTHNCPTTLAKDESCDVDVYYHVSNQDPDSGPVPEEIKKLKYDVAIKVDYLKDPLNSQGALNGYFYNIISTKIQAEFEANQESTDFTESTVTGRRSSVTFLLKNTGYQAGVLHKIYMYDDNDVMLGKCHLIANAEGYLECFEVDGSEVMTSNPVLLKNLPFFVKDRSGCFTPSGGTEVLTAVDGICALDVFFQPSVQFSKQTSETAHTKKVKLSAEYDTKWKGLETIVDHNVHEVSAIYEAAAKLVLDQITYGDLTCAPTTEGCRTEALVSNNVQQFTARYDSSDPTDYIGCEDNLNNHYFEESEVSELECEDKFKFNSYAAVDLERIALINPSFAAGQGLKLTVRIKNIGKQAATNIKYYVDRMNVSGNEIDTIDQSGTEFFGDSNPTSIGVDATHKYYTDLKYTESDCMTIAENGTCSFSVVVSPIALAAATESANCRRMKSMFTNEHAIVTGQESVHTTAGIDCSAVSDVSAQLAFDPFKMFSIEYDDASVYYDENLYNAEKDIARRRIDLRLHATLVAKGALSSLSYQNKNFKGEMRRVEHKDIVLQNIGTGKVPYIGWKGFRTVFGGSEVKVVGDSVNEMDNLNILPVSDGDLASVEWQNIAGTNVTGVNFDCTKIIDFNYDPNTTAMAGINTRKLASIDSLNATYSNFATIKNNWNGRGLEMGETCVLRIQKNAEFRGVDIDYDDYMSNHNLKTGSAFEDNLAHNAYALLLSLKNIEDSTYDKKYILINDRLQNRGFEVELEYFDGDNEPSSNPSIQALINAGESDSTHVNVAFGGKMTKDNTSLGSAQVRVTIDTPGKPVFSTAYPYNSAFFYHSLYNFDENLELFWFWLSGNVVNSITDSGGDSYFPHMMGAAPVDAASSTPATNIELALNTKYATNFSGVTLDTYYPDSGIHFGAYPQGLNIKMGFTIEASSIGSEVEILREKLTPISVAGGNNDLAFDQADLTTYDGTAMVRDFTFNPNVNGLYTYLYELEYTNGIIADPTCQKPQGGDPDCELQKFYTSVVILVRAVDAAVLTMQVQDCIDPNLDDNDYSCNWVGTGDYIDLPLAYNGMVSQRSPVTTPDGQGNDVYTSCSDGLDGSSYSADNILLENCSSSVVAPPVEFIQIIQQAPNLTNAASVRRRIHFQNNTAHTINNANWLYRETLVSTSPFDSNTSIDSGAIYMPGGNLDSNSITCGNSSNKTFTFNPGSSCYFEFIYQPNEDSSPSEMYIKWQYAVAAQQYISQGAFLEFVPESPASLALDTTLANAEVAFAPKFDDPNDSYPDTLVQYGEANKTYQYTLNGTTYLTSSTVLWTDIIEVVNSSETNASFLRQYQLTQDPTWSNPAVSELLVPPANEYVDDEGDGFMGYPLYTRTTEVGVMTAYMTEACFVGDNAESGKEKGFNQDDTCEMKVKYELNVNASGLNIKSSDVSDSYISIPYWNYKRASTDTFYMYLRFKVLPNRAISGNISGDKYSNVSATIDSTGGVVSFDWAAMSVNDAGLGNIVGYRVYYNTEDSQMDGSLTSNIVWGEVDSETFNASYVDLDASTTTVQISGLDKRTYYYFRVVPIRNDSNYTVNKFTGLTGGDYISESDITFLTVVTPTDNYYYDHDSFKLYEIDESNLDELTRTDAIDYCKDFRLKIYKDGQEENFYHELIDVAARDFLISVDANFGESRRYWINRNFISVESAGYNSIVGYIADQEEQDWTYDNTNYYYYRDSDDPTGNNLISFYGYYTRPRQIGVFKYIPSWAFGYARCSIDL